MAREGRQGLTPAYTAYRGLGSDSDGRWTGGKILSRQGAKARYPANRGREKVARSPLSISGARIGA